MIGNAFPISTMLHGTRRRDLPEPVQELNCQSTHLPEPVQDSGSLLAGGLDNLFCMQVMEMIAADCAFVQQGISRIEHGHHVVRI